MPLTAQALAARGLFDEAIALGTDENRRERQPTLERDLVRWRHEAFFRIDRSPRRVDWPPVYPDPFPDVPGLPELSASRLNAAQLGGAITHHGALIVRGLLTGAECRDFVTGINRAMAAREAARDSETHDGSWYSQYPLPPDSGLILSRPWLRSQGGLLSADSPRMLFDLTDTFRSKGIDRLVADYLGERPAISVGKSTLRRVGIKAAVDWHQDGAFLGRDIVTVDLWIALTDCGLDAPGLDIVPRRLSGIVHTGTAGAEYDWSVGHEVALRTAEGRPILSPHFEAGDAILFDHLLLHRTGVRPSMVRERWAIETWFFAPSSYPMDQEPLLL